MDLVVFATLSGTGGLVLGLYLGMWSRDAYWCGKAEGPQRACSMLGGLFHVVRDGDVRRADEVREFCEP